MSCCARVVCVVGLAVVGLVSSDAGAQVSAPDFAFHEPGAEVALTVASLASLATALLPQQRSSWGPSHATARHDGLDFVSDFTGGYVGTSWQIVGSYALEAAYYETSNVKEPFGRALRSSLIDLQAVTLATGITYLLKRTTGRCRPRAWHDGRCGPKPEHDAFPSGHVAPVAAVAGSRLWLAARSDGAATRRFIAFGLAEATTIATMVLRVMAGAHSWEDVLGGWAVGHATGSLVSLAHPMDTLEPSSAQTALESTQTSSPAGLVWSGSF